ncbi:glycosyltransferase [Kovacikia minuta CCNUW1]|uniref:glycosyltransferase n=1 Tax=Kovacikia minuta TaxID=2931930 RepID=UPI001CCEDB29|nr:glycosyltransferase [Kovacikia minuta]UBF27340.1 glycosyltransferase [Kovacikia minuta CCNUW1]
MMPQLSVVIPTYKPNRVRLERTLEGLQQQTFNFDQWELLIIDNATPDIHYLSSFDTSWHPQAVVIRENCLGLTRARLTGIQASRGEYIVFVDDDNVLHPDYLKNAVEIFQNNSEIGVIGGKSLPEFESLPETWTREFDVCLALRDFGDEVRTYSFCKQDGSGKSHPEFAPIGAGMGLRKVAAQFYADLLQSDSTRQAFDRTGRSLQSGGDCDINLTLLEAGWEIGYFPQLQLTHLIPAGRVTTEYLARVNYASSRSWIQVLDVHGIRPWQKIPGWTVLPRQIKAFFSYKPWSSPAAYIRWRAACGTFEGLGALPD